MIYIFDNGEVYSNHALYFVDAPEDFGAWFNDVYLPWVDGAVYRPLMIVATAPAVERRIENVRPARENPGDMKQVIATCEKCGGAGITTEEDLETSGGKMSHRDPGICANVRRNTGSR
jgi:hypothetical protein